MGLQELNLFLITISTISVVFIIFNIYERNWGETARLYKITKYHNEVLNSKVQIIQQENEIIKKKNMETEDLLYRLHTFFGFEREIHYRDLDGELYPLDMGEIKNILKEREHNEHS